MGGEGGDPAEGVDRLHLEVLSDGVDVALVISSKARRDSRTLRVEKVSLAQVLWIEVVSHLVSLHESGLGGG